jgi:hypothetical protein
VSAWVHVRRRGSAIAARAALVALCLGAGGISGTAQAQSRDENVFQTLFRLASSVTDQTRDTVFSFLETVEMFDLEGEVDRLVGSPWELSDSTTYKLRLLPLNLGAPMYETLGRMMTRQDELRSQRVQSVASSSVETIALRMDSLDLRRQRAKVLASTLTYFNVREMADLAVFALAQQPLFPDTQDGWELRKRQIGRNKGKVIAGVLLAGAAFDAGTFGQSGTIVKRADGLARLGWYGGLRRLGLGLQPLLRGGLTAQVPGVEVAAGLTERINPDDDATRRSVELAAREGWLNRLGRPAGVDLFVESALRRVLDAGPAYTGETTTGRAGVFMRRENFLRTRDLVLRSSIEAEGDFSTEMRYAAGVGLEHVRSGITVALQSSRTSIENEGLRYPETRGGFFVAGTMDPPVRHFVDGMKARARAARDEWQRVGELEERRRLAEARVRALATTDPGGPDRRAALEALGAAVTALEGRVARLGVLLADYLESRRRAYAVTRLPRVPGDLHGPLDPTILVAATRLVQERGGELAALLRSAEADLAPLHRKFHALRAAADRAANDPVARTLTAAYTDDLHELDRAWRQVSAPVRAALEGYTHYEACSKRIAAASELVRGKDAAWLPEPVVRRIAALTAPPLQ